MHASPGRMLLVYMQAVQVQQRRLSQVSMQCTMLTICNV